MADNEPEHRPVLDEIEEEVREIAGVRLTEYSPTTAMSDIWQEAPTLHTVRY